MINLITGPGYAYWIGLDGNQYGLTLNGYNAPPMTEILAELQADWKQAFGPNIDISYNSPDGQVIGIMADKIMSQENLNLGMYDGWFPDTAQGQSLANVASITNFTPLPPSYSTKTVTVNGTIGTVLPDTFQLSVTGAPSSVFQIMPDQFYTIGSGGTVNVNMIALTTGPTVSNSGTLVNIVTPVSGVASITDSANANLGSALETEAQIRLRRFLTLAQAGPNVSQIVSSLLKLTGITNAGGTENDTDFTDANGNLPHSVSILAQGVATNLAIATTIFNNKSGGIATNGNTSIVVTDNQNVQHTIKFSTPSNVMTYYSITYTVATNPLDGIFPTNGATAIQNAVLNYLALQLVGQDVVLLQLSQYIVSQVPGIIGLVIQAGLAPNPVGTSNLSMNYNQLAVSIAANIAVQA